MKDIETIKADAEKSRLEILKQIGYDNDSITTTEKWIAEEVYKMAYEKGRLEAQKPYWVSVDERLPDPCSEVIVYLTNGEGVFVAYFDGDRKFYNEKQDRLISPTHWQYLPQPPVSLNNIKE